MIFKELLHKDDITIEEVRKLYKYICNNSDGIDVPQLRLEYGYTDDDDTLWKWYRGMFYATKSKLTGSFKFCMKGFQISVLFGIRGEGNVIMRQGSNEHFLMELIYDKLNSKKLKELYIKRKSIKSYVKHKLELIFTELIGGKTLKDTLNTIDNTEGERDHYILSINAIARWLNRQYKQLVKLVGLNKVDEYFYPIGVEVELYDHLMKRHGLIDAVYKNPRGGYIVVDYKFGKPKRKKDQFGEPTEEPYYYMPSINLELWFYKWLAETPNAIEADENSQDLKTWKPIYCSRGEMWYVLDYDYGQLYTTYNQNDELALIKLEEDYWSRMDTMDYPFDPYLGWKKQRFRKICNKKKNDGTYVCDKRSICNNFTSFREYINEDTLMDEFDNVMTKYDE